MVTNNADLTIETSESTLAPKLSGLLNLTADVPEEFQKEVEHRLSILQQEINNTVCELLNKFAELKNNSTGRTTLP